MMSRHLQAPDEAEWDAYVLGTSSGHSCHLTGWKRVIERSFRHETYYLLSRDDCGAIDGVLPIVRLRSWLFGDFLVSVPYLNYGGPCADREVTSRRLVEDAAQLARTLGVQHLEIRTDTDADYGLRTRSSKVSMQLRLPSSAETLWQSFSSKLRSQVKRARQEPMTVHIGREEWLDDFYRVFAENMRDLGTPVYPRSFFRCILREFATSTWICAVRLRDKPVAAGLLLGFRDVLEIPWASSLRRYSKLSPNMLLYWSVLEFACGHGFRLFDFGRSSPDSGTFRFKAQWGAKAVPLHWHYWLRENNALPDLSPRNPKMQTAIRIWRRLPVAVTQILGPPIVRRLP